MSDGGLRAAVVGCRGIGRMHAAAIHDSREMTLVAACDVAGEHAREMAAKHPGIAAFTDLGQMLREVEPDIVAVCTPTDSHAALTLQAIEAGVKGVCCEKPMATSMADGRAMVEACGRKGAQLIVNHQRRTYPPFIKMGEMISGGAIGDVHLLRGTCAGDVLSDGTHLVDSILWLAGDQDAKWVFGAVYRPPPDPAAPRGMGYDASGGWRYGHPIETGAFGTWEFKNGLRAEILCGDLRFPGRGYHDIEAIGAKGRLWRAGDQADPAVLIQAAGSDGWQPVPVPASDGVIAANYDLLARNMRAGDGDHPLSGRKALRGFEIVMAVYESARLRARIELPLNQDRFPLELMIAEGKTALL